MNRSIPEADGPGLDSPISEKAHSRALDQGLKIEENEPQVSGGSCMEPGCSAPATESFVGHKKGREPLTYRTCREHKMPLSIGLVTFGMVESIEYDGAVA